MINWEAPQPVPKDAMETFSFGDRLCKYLVPDPLKWVELDKYPYLRCIATPSTGTNHIDLKECKRRGIKVLSLMDDKEALQEIRASSEFTFQLILHALHRPFQQYKRYDRNEEAMRGNELYGKKVGIVGFGRIGQNVSKWCAAFGASSVLHDPLFNSSAKLEHLFMYEDIVVISCSLTPETEGMITKRHLNLMQPGAILVNTARAEIIKQKDLEEWAKKGDNTYAADVLHGEVLGKHVNSPLLSLGNCIITPHIAGTTYESQEKAARIALDLLRKEIANEAVR